MKFSLCFNPKAGRAPKETVFPDYRYEGKNGVNWSLGVWICLFRTFQDWDPPEKPPGIQVLGTL
ncbi:MAG: hypothetical protein AMJ94_09395 [Deltaproteobacteria bacterium SM23_61]|nr:MAG: hypothetical protein AMJ94_09395 [Deltaproteobacteria bacterium SM23_61]